MAENATKQPSVAAGSARRTGTRRADTQGMQGMGCPLTAMTSLASASGNHAVSGLLGGGTALPPQVLAEMESRFGQSFADVRVHDDSRAHASAAGLQAKAYTHGQHIVFGAHRFAPHAGEGKRLMAHELAHVVQQRRGGSLPALDAGAAHEQSADAAAAAVVGGQGSVAVAGGTAVGVARNEDDSWGARLRRKAHALKESIPEEYREKLQAAGDYAADKAVDVMVAPLGPAAMYAADGLGSSLLHSGQKLAAGESGVSQDLKNFGRDKVQEGLGAAKGVVTQLTEVADTAMWVGNEYKELRDSAAKKVGGKEGSFGNEAVKKVIDTTARILPGTGALPDLANASDAAKAAGLIDEDTKQASLTAPMSKKLNEYAKAAEEALGASPREPEMFSPMEKAELGSNIVTQVALSFTGAEEVKIAMNVVGALSGLRGIVESIRNEKDWKTSSRFWGSLIGMGLSIVGLKHSLAAGKITTLILKFGWVAAAIPPLAQMATDYYFLETHPELDAQQRKDVEARIKQGWVAAIHVIKDAILHVAQSQGGNSAKPGAAGEEGSQTASKGGASKAGGEGETPATKPTAVDAEPAPVAKLAADAPANAAPAASVATPVSPPTTTAKPPAVTHPAAAASPSTAAAPSNLRPLRGAKPAAPSAASAKLEQTLSRQPAPRKGSVTRLQPRASAEGPGSEPMQQKQPVALAEPQKIAVGQTHGPETSAPALRSVGGPEPTVAALKASGRSGGKRGPGPATGSATSSAPARGTKSAGPRQAASTAKSKPPAATAAGKKGGGPLAPVNTKGGRGGNAEPLVAVRVAGGGSRRKGTYWVEGSPEFAAAATNERFVVLPESQAKALGARPAGTPFNQDIKPYTKNGVQMESGSAGTGKSNKHNISARADTHADADVRASTFEKTIGASRSEAHGQKVLLDAGEYAVLRPGNASTGGVDSITAQVPPAGAGTGKVFLNDFTGPQTSKGAKPTHANWVKELGAAIKDSRFGFNNAATDRAVLNAIKSGEVYVRTMRVEYTEAGPRMSTDVAPVRMKVPAEVQRAADVALARLDAGAKPGGRRRGKP